MRIVGIDAVKLEYRPQISIKRGHFLESPVVTIVRFGIFAIANCQLRLVNPIIVLPDLFAALGGKDTKNQTEEDSENNFFY